MAFQIIENLGGGLHILGEGVAINTRVRRGKAAIVTIRSETMKKYGFERGNRVTLQIGDEDDCDILLIRKAANGERHALKLTGTRASKSSTVSSAGLLVANVKTNPCQVIEELSSYGNLFVRLPRQVLRDRTTMQAAE